MERIEFQPGRSARRRGLINRREAGRHGLPRGQFGGADAAAEIHHGPRAVLHRAAAGVHIVGEQPGDHLTCLLPAGIGRGGSLPAQPFQRRGIHGGLHLALGEPAKPMSITSAASPIRPTNIITNNTST